jgi:hypothetical protein
MADVWGLQVPIETEGVKVTQPINHRIYAFFVCMWSLVHAGCHLAEVWALVEPRDLPLGWGQWLRFGTTLQTETCCGPGTCGGP